MEKRVPDLYIEQQLLGELSTERASKVTENPQTPEKTREFEESNREILEKYPPGMMAERILAKLNAAESEAAFHGINEGSAGEKESSRSDLRKIIPLLAAAALAVAVILPVSINRVDSDTSVTQETGTRIKGLEPHLNVYRKNGEKVELLKDETPVNNFDLIQLSYISGGKKYGAIFSIDGNGFITLHYPDFTGISPELETGREIPLDFSYQLDDAPDFERFFFVTSDTSFPVENVLQSAAELNDSRESARSGTLEVPSGLEINSLLLLKEGSNE